MPFRDNNYPIIGQNRLQLRIIVTSIKNSGDDILFTLLKRIPGIFSNEYPLRQGITGHGSEVFIRLSFIEKKPSASPKI